MYALFRAFAALALTLLARPAFAQDTLQSLHDAAKKEGKLVYWGSPDSQTAADLARRFKARFPGIDVEVFKIQPAPAIERIVTAQQAGRAEVDVMDSQLGYLQLLFDRNLVVSYPWTKTFDVDPTRVLFDGRALSIWHLDSPIAYNTQLVKAGDIKAWDDLTDLKWRGKLLVEARGFAFAILALKWGEERAMNYIKAIMAQKPIITKGGTATVEALAGGQGMAAIGAYAGSVEMNARNGAPIDWVRAGPVPTAYGLLMQLSNAPHPNAARLWMHFMTTKDAREAIFAGQGLDIAFGRDAGVVGKKYEAAGLEVVPETSEIQRMQDLVTKAGALIGSM
jgi:iron(III) transport system substrate-binding protein